MKRIIIAGIAGGIVMFLWGAILHMLLPVGGMGIKTLPDEDTVVAAFKQSISEPGLYFFPGMDMSRKLTPEEQKAWEEKYAAGPTGILVYQPHGGTELTAGPLLTEVASDIVAALLLAWVISLMVASYAARFLAAAILGLFAWLTLSISYWNWYGFPGSFILAEGIDQVIGWGLSGLVTAKIVRPRAA